MFHMWEREERVYLSSSKYNLDTPNGRIQFARSQKGYTQEEFATKVSMGISNWKKIEQGNRKISIDLILTINLILKLDIRYYFGEIPYEEALNPEARYKDLVESIESLKKKVMSPQEIDPIAERVMINNDLNNLVRKIVYLPGELLRELDSYISGFLAGKGIPASQSEREKKHA